MEIVPALAVSARERLTRLRYDVYQRIGDGYRGWPSEAPFDRIVVTAAPRELPSILLEQLSVGGILVAPVGPAEDQRLTRYIKTEEGVRTEDLGPIRFVPMVNGD
jgi:protein-L-isoaspartate(D-aspartate) O-methyltransferase